MPWEWFVVFERYQTTLVIAGLLPVDILTEQESWIYIKRTTIQDTGNWSKAWEWHHQWSDGRPDWIAQRKTDWSGSWFRLLVCVSQFGHENSPGFPTCPGEKEDAEYAIFYCSRHRILALWKDKLEKLEKAPHRINGEEMTYLIW